LYYTLLFFKQSKSTSKHITKLFSGNKMCQNPIITINMLGAGAQYTVLLL